MVKSLDEQIKSLQERQAQLKAREDDLKATVTKALEHCIKTSQGMHENLHDLVYDALSEEWARRDGEISDPWEDEPAGGYQPPSYEPVNPERRSPQTPSGALI